MNQKPLFLAIAALALITIGGAFCFIQKRQVAVSQPVVADPVVEVPVQAEPENPVDTSDWKTYRNEELGFEFQYPANLELVLDRESGSIWGTDDVKEEIILKKEGNSFLLVLHTSKDSLDMYRKKLRELDSVAEKNREGKIVQSEVKVLVNGTDGIRIDYCSYSLAGVNCNLILTTYYFLLKDGSYISMRADQRWGGKEGVDALNQIAKSLSTFP